jgi:hypothetical protein
MTNPYFLFPICFVLLLLLLLLLSSLLLPFSFRSHVVTRNKHPGYQLL